MDELDPNAIPPDFEQQAIAIARQRKVAELLRKQAGGPPEGQMVSGRYVKPTMAQQLLPLLGGFNAHSVDLGADKNEGAYNRQASEARDKWESVLPQAVAGRAALPGPRAEGGSPELEAIAAQPLTTGRILKHTLAGRRIPGNEKNADLVAAMLGKEMDREDTQAARKEQTEAANQLALQKQRQAAEDRLAELKLRFEDRGLDRQSREQIAAEGRALTKLIADMNNDTRLAGIQATKDAKEAKAAEPKPVSTTVMKDLGGLENNATGLTAMATRYKPEYGGVGGAYDKLSGTWNPFAGKDAEDAANWWKDYESQAALVERHEKFGTALSAGEQAAWKNATISPGMNKATIDHNLKERAKIANQLFNKTREAYIKGGHTGVKDAFEERPGGDGAGPTVVKTGKDASGRKVEQMSDGTVRYAPGP